MKKPYIRPVMAFESLALSASAGTGAGCGLLATNSPEYVCPVTDPESGWTLFSSYDNCMMIPPSNDEICYDIPLANNNVFGS